MAAICGRRKGNVFFLFLLNLATRNTFDFFIVDSYLVRATKVVESVEIQRSTPGARASSVVTGAHRCLADAFGLLPVVRRRKTGVN